jgi:hypothetical protein
MAVAQDEMLTFLEEELPVIDGITSTETSGSCESRSWATSGSCGRKTRSYTPSGRGCEHRGHPLRAVSCSSHSPATSGSKTA